MRISSVFWVVLFAAGCGAGPDGEPQGPQIQLGQQGLAEHQDEVAEPENPQPARKIIYNATLEIAVEDFAAFPAEVDRLIQQFEAFVADSHVSGLTSSPRYGTWKIRVPVKNYTAFIEEARNLGELRSERQSSEDVSENFYDIEARLKNKQQEEQRLKELLDRQSGTLEDILAVEKEISRVRGEVEQLQGRLRVMTDLTSFSTVTLIVQEIKDYVPEQSATFSTRIGRSWSTSLNSLFRFGQEAVIAAVFIGPWFCLFGIPAVIIVWWIRRRRSRKILDA